MPTSEEHKAAVIRQICEQKELEPAEVALDARLVEDLGFDSLDVFELVAELEEAFDAPIPDELLADVRTVQDAVDVVDRVAQRATGGAGDGGTAAGPAGAAT